MTVTDTLREMDERSWDEQLKEYERLERQGSAAGPYRPSFARDDPGHPLGVGMPTGATIRDDGESHLAAWMRIVRADPCSYCGRVMGGLVEASADHVVPKSRPAGALGGVHTWLNLVGACVRCNGKKGSAVTMLEYLYRRRWSRTWRQPDPAVEEELRSAA